MGDAVSQERDGATVGALHREKFSHDERARVRVARRRRMRDAALRGGGE